MRRKFVVKVWSSQILRRKVSNTSRVTKTAVNQASGSRFAALEEAVDANADVNGNVDMSSIEHIGVHGTVASKGQKVEVIAHVSKVRSGSHKAMTILYNSVQKDKTSASKGFWNKNSLRSGLLDGSHKGLMIHKNGSRKDSYLLPVVLPLLAVFSRTGLLVYDGSFLRGDEQFLVDFHPDEMVEGAECVAHDIDLEQ
ncbi:hypothetical protein V6N13_024840 [Hibiscus sabdariffa]